MQPTTTSLWAAITSQQRHDNLDAAITEFQRARSDLVDALNAALNAGEHNHHGRPMRPAERCPASQADCLVGVARALLSGNAT